MLEQMKRHGAAFCTVAALGMSMLAGCAGTGKMATAIPMGTIETFATPLAPDPEPERVHNLMFGTISPGYLADNADEFAAKGIDGFMMAGLMRNWDSDIWAQPTQWTPDAPKGRVGGEENPLFQLCRRMNEQSRAAGIEYNSVKIAFYSYVPDWFDDAGWATLVENFRQGAIFARDAGFAGITLDIEYISEIYNLDYEAYLAPEYPRDQLREKARQRGNEIMAAMLGEFPNMINWQLPAGIMDYGPLAGDLFIGMVDALAEADAPGGFHLSPERTYLLTEPSAIITFANRLDTLIRSTLRDHDRKALDYWERRGTINYGLWPLGYYRGIYDENGELLGYSGKQARFGNEIVGSYADKSENYSAEEFQRQYATARTVARRFVWIYGHGPVVWQMTPEEKARYHASDRDTAATVANLDEYLDVLRNPRVLGNSWIQSSALAVRNGDEPNGFLGYPPVWRMSAAPSIDPTSLGTVAPATEFTRVARPDAFGYIDLKQLYPESGNSPVVWAKATFENDRPQRVFIGMGSNDDAVVYVNGKQVFHVETERGRPELFDDDIIAMNLSAGRSEVVIGVADRGGSQWGFYLRIADGTGKQADGIRWTTVE
ncbi:MAG TPA: hypothetical protein ENN56_04015 [Firmicutes bacterium]|nr:hypothetical protein [Bacillota bacterium]